MKVSSEDKSQTDTLRIKEDNGKVITNGGRVIAIASFGNDFREALDKSYQNMEKLHFDGMYYRKDIGFDL